MPSVLLALPACLRVVSHDLVAGGITIALLMAINFLFGAFSQLADVTVMAVRQAITPIQLQGWVVATINFTGMGLTPLGSLLGGYLAGKLGLRTSLLLTAVGVSLSPLIIAVSPPARLGKVLPAAHEPIARYHADGEPGNA